MDKELNPPVNISTGEDLGSFIRGVLVMVIGIWKLFFFEKGAMTAACWLLLLLYFFIIKGNRPGFEDRLS